MSAYDLNRAVKMHGPLYRAFSRGNLYEQLAHLERTRVVSARQEDASRGPRATKTVYALTPSGRRRFDTLLSAACRDVQVSDSTFEVACVLLGQLPRTRACRILSERLQELVAHEGRLVRLYGDPKERSGASLLAMTHAQSRVKSEIAWVRDALAKLKRRTWKPEWQNDDDATLKGRRLP
jgi:DNA-binding PadR family transcriptional regulator